MSNRKKVKNGTVESKKRVSNNKREKKKLRPLQPAVMPHTHARLTAHRTQPVATTHGDDEHSANGGDEHGANDGDDPHAVNIAIQLNGGRKFYFSFFFSFVFAV